MLGYGAGVPFGCEGRAGTWNWQYNVAISDAEKTGEEGQKVHFWAHYAKDGDGRANQRMQSGKMARVKFRVDSERLT